MRVFQLQASEDGTACRATGVNQLGAVFSVLANHATRVNGTIEYTFTYSQTLRLMNFGDVIEVHYMTGTLDGDGKIISGRWGYKEDDQPDSFILWRDVPLTTLICRPHPEEFKKDRVKALWKYALTAAHNEARRNLFSWSYIKERRDIRREFLELRRLENEDDDIVMSPKYLQRLGAIHGMSTKDDMRWFYLFYERQNSISWCICKYCIVVTIPSDVLGTESRLCIVQTGGFAMLAAPFPSVALASSACSAGLMIHSTFATNENALVVPSRAHAS